MENILTPDLKQVLPTFVTLFILTMWLIWGALTHSYRNKFLTYKEITWHLLTPKNKPKLKERVLAVSKEELFQYTDSHLVLVTLYKHKSGRLYWYFDDQDPKEDEGLPFDCIYVWAKEPNYPQPKGE